MFTFIYGCIFTVGIISNGLLIVKIRRKMTVANVFLLNLGV